MAELSAIDRYIIDKVREFREAKKYSQEHLSLLVGKAEGYIGNVESPKRGKHYNTKMLNELAKALECSPKDFWPDQPL
ncbi:helix-turn-helix transcriptional regulator [Chitinophaga varians]|uniref:Helix-turn-helix transcriptional regulator n=1 Tax=Chitinophaga varians TaxID=2202339 RepID=A0A847RNK8_9BACT|nr:helix-turn-helix transcriptional regulator [Chitinophaga varians]NLR67330.1 helix-turn-helix transcriptional regulator [Chitinophaga varians]